MKKDKDKLYIEGIFGFLGNFRLWLLWAFPFFLIDFVLNTLLNKWEPEKSLDDKLDQIWPIAIPVAVLYLIVECYFFVLFFLKQGPLNDEPKFSWQRLFYSLAQFIFAIVLIFAPFGLLHLRNYLDANLGADSLSEKARLIIHLLGFLIACFISIYLGIRCMAVMPLAVSNIKFALGKSWQLTSGNMWRICWNAFLWWMLTFFFLGLAQAGQKKLISVQFDSEMVKMFMDFIAQVIDSAIGTISMGCIAAFMCAVCRILYRENEPEAAGP